VVEPADLDATERTMNAVARHAGAGPAGDTAECGPVGLEAADPIGR